MNGKRKINLKERLWNSTNFTSLAVSVFNILRRTYVVALNPSVTNGQHKIYPLEALANVWG
jgi:hypothetical protein